MSDPLRLFWFAAVPNFGDMIGPWMAERVTGHPPEPGEPSHGTILSSGSILNWAGIDAVVWGSGIANLTDPINPCANILAVRGPISRARALAYGATCPDIVGDPGLLLPRFLGPRPAVVTKIGIVPHLSDRPAILSMVLPADMRAVDLFRPVPDVAAAIASCERIVTSSLHGMIAAHAYGVPAALVQFGDGVLGDGTKFDDHRVAVGLAPRPAIDLRSRFTVGDMAKLPADAPEPGTVERIADQLWECCPFR